MKIKINSMLKASIFYIFGNGIGQGLILLGTIIFTRIMTKEAYGLYSTYYSLVSILTTVVGFNLFEGLCNAYIDYKKEIYSFRSSVLMLSTIIFGCIVVASIGFVYLFKIQISYVVIVFALIHAYSFFVINYYSYSANMENQYRKKTILMIIPNLLQVLLPIILIYIFSEGNTYNLRIVGSTVGVLICAIIVYTLILKKDSPCYVKAYWHYALRISVPSVLSSISYLLMQQCDKIMITNFYNAEETAVYSLVYTIGYLLYAVLQAVNGALQAWMYRILEIKDYRNVKKLQKWYLTVFLLMACCLMMIAPELVKILSPKGYWKFNYIPPFVFSSCLMMLYTFYVMVGMFYKKSSQVSMCVAAGAIVNVILNYVMIPKFGGVAAAYTTVVSYFIVFILTRRLSQKLCKDLFSLKYFIVFLCTLIICCVLFFMTYTKMWMRYITFMSLILIILGYLFLNRKEIIGLIKG